MSGTSPASEPQLPPRTDAGAPTSDQPTLPPVPKEDPAAAVVRLTREVAGIARQMSRLQGQLAEEKRGRADDATANALELETANKARLEEKTRADTAEQALTELRRAVEGAAKMKLSPEELRQLLNTVEDFIATQFEGFRKTLPKKPDSDSTQQKRQRILTRLDQLARELAFEREKHQQRFQSIETLQTQLRTRGQELQNLLDAQATFDRTLDQKNSELTRAQEFVVESSRKLDEAKAELEVEKAQTAEREVQIESLTTRLAAANRLVEDLERRIATATQSNKELTRSLDDANRENDRLSREVDSLEGQLTVEKGKTQRAERLITERSALEAQMSPAEILGRIPESIIRKIQELRSDPALVRKFFQDLINQPEIGPLFLAKTAFLASMPPPKALGLVRTTTSTGQDIAAFLLAEVAKYIGEKKAFGFIAALPAKESASVLNNLDEDTLHALLFLALGNRDYPHIYYCKAVDRHADRLSADLLANLAKVCPDDTVAFRLLFGNHAVKKGVETLRVYFEQREGIRAPHTTLQAYEKKFEITGERSEDPSIAAAKAKLAAYEILSHSREFVDRIWSAFPLSPEGLARAHQVIGFDPRDALAMIGHFSESAA